MSVSVECPNKKCQHHRSNTKSFEDLGSNFCNADYIKLDHELQCSFGPPRKEVKGMTTVNCPYAKCRYNERARCTRDVTVFTMVEGEEMKCNHLETPSEERMEVPDKDLVTYSLGELSAERGWIMKALDDDILVDEDHWWRSQMYARLAAIELLIHSYDNWE